jgi:hypothetical protein
MESTVPYGLFVGNPFVDASAGVTEEFLQKHNLQLGAECPPLTDANKRVLIAEVQSIYTVLNL